jgi:small subunit ribosomal protein S18
MHCICCEQKITSIDYKRADILRNFVTGTFRIKGSHKTELCQKHQRKVENAIKLARFMALMPYTRNQVRQK